MSDRNRFFDSISYKDPRRFVTTRIRDRVSRFAGMPAGAQLRSEWFMHHIDFNDAASVPQNGIGWTLTATGAGSVALSDDIFPPHLVITTAAADNDSLELQWTAPDGGGEWASFIGGTTRDERGGRPHFFEIMCRLEDANTDADTVEQVEWFFGFAVTDTAVIDGTADYVGFRNRDLDDDAAQDIDLVSGDAGGAAALVGGALVATGWDTGVTALVASDGIVADDDTIAGQTLRRNRKTLGASDWIKMAFMVIPGEDIATTNEGVAHYWINDVYEGSADLAGQVPDQRLCPTIAFQNGEAVAKRLNIAHLTFGAAYRGASVNRDRIGTLI